MGWITNRGRARPALLAALVMAAALVPARALASEQDPVAPGPRVQTPALIVLPSLEEMFARAVTPHALRAKGIAFLPLVRGTSTLGLIVRGQL